MRKLLCLYVCVLLCAWPVPAFAGESGPQVDAQAAIIMDALTGRVLWEKNAHQPMAMASTTKIMTAAMALESGRGPEMVTVSPKAAAAPKMKMFLSAGEEISLDNLLLALMLESSNDAAVAIAEHLSGSVDAFCQEMTAKAQTLGAFNTVFETASGLDAGDHHSTAYDLAIITRYALTVPGFLGLINTPDAAFASNTRTYAKHNKNRLLREYPGANGVKTGFTNKAGHCFVGAAKRGDMQLITVVLASGWGEKGKAQKWTDTKTLLDYGFQNFAYQQLVTAGEAAGDVACTRSRTGQVGYVFAQDFTLPLHRNTPEAVDVRLNVPPSVAAPVAEGQTVGTAQVFVDGELQANIPLTATEAATRHDVKTSTEKIFSQWIQQVTDQPVKLTLPEVS